ncbi:MAG: hypothetical protein IH602_08370 [Bryobacteraceae bacterium]|nr:hypothetical protein [Bryobacteraceae bacterium]
MSDPSVIIMSVFVLLIIGGLGLAIRQGIRERQQVAEYSAAHGWTVSVKPDEQLTRLLAAFDPASDSFPRNVMIVERSPSPVYFFRYTRRPKDRPSKDSNGFGCFTRSGGMRFDGRVEIFNRTPGVEKLIDDLAKVGSEEFQEAFTVTENVPGTAVRIVSHELEKVMMSHSSGPGWYVNVEIANGAILVSSSWTQSKEEWDYLIDLTKRIRGAVR